MISQDTLSLITLNNTGKNEGANSLHTQLHPKDWCAFD